jgi:hypothetical protein
MSSLDGARMNFIVVVVACHEPLLPRPKIGDKFHRSSDWFEINGLEGSATETTRNEGAIVIQIIQ